MSVHVSSWVWRHSKSSGVERLLLLALADMANDEGVAWPSVKSLGERCNCSDRAIQSALPKAVERKELIVVRKFSKNGHPTSNIYQFTAFSQQNDVQGVVNYLHHVVQNIRGGGELSAPSSETSLETSSETPPIVPQAGDGAEFSKNGKKPKKEKLTVEYVLATVRPDLTLQSPAFMKALTSWVKNRLELPKPTIGSFIEHVRRCELLGEDRAIAAIHYSIANNYLSIYEPRRDLGQRLQKVDPWDGL